MKWRILILLFPSRYKKKGLACYTKKDFSGLARVLALQDLRNELGS